MMKQVLIIDETPLFREYLRTKLIDSGVDAAVAVNGLDGISKLRTVYPDLIIIDYHLSRPGTFEALRQKKQDPNTVNIPVIITAKRIDQQRIRELIPFNVKKIFTKPIKIDALFSTISEILGVKFELDETPSILDVHVNDSIIFIEIAQGLNQDKLELLRFKILELIDIYDIKVPKLIIMISDVKLSFIDGPNLKKLLDIAVRIPKIKNRNIRILTRDEFARQYITGQKEYSEIEVVTNLQYAIDRFVSDLNAIESGEKKAEIIGDRLLQTGAPAAGESMALRFHSEVNAENVNNLMRNLRIAVVDDDYAVQEQMRNIFSKVGAAIKPFFDGEAFLSSLDNAQYDLLFLNMFMPGIDGFTVLKALNEMGIPTPVIALSAMTQRETVLQAFKLGVKNYVLKPLKSDDIIKKTAEIVRTTF